MAIQNSLLNRRGQILIESVVLLFIVSAVLIVFKQMIEYQKSRQHFRFSPRNKEAKIGTELFNTK